MSLTMGFDVTMRITEGREHYTDDQLMIALMKGCLISNGCQSCSKDSKPGDPPAHPYPYMSANIMNCKYTRRLFRELVQPLILEGKGHLPSRCLYEEVMASIVPLLTFELEYTGCFSGGPVRQFFSGGRLVKKQYL